MTKIKDFIAAITALITAIIALIGILEKYDITNFFEKINFPLLYLSITCLVILFLYLEWEKVTIKLLKPISIWSWKNGGILVFLLWLSLTLSFINLVYTKKQSDRYLSLSRSLITTQYLGGFPENMREISRLIDSANESLFISVDFPAYGHFSQPEKYQMYKAAVTKSRNSNFKLVFRHYSDDFAREVANKDWSQYTDLTEIKNDKKTFKKWASIQGFTGSSVDDFIEALLEADRQFIGSVKSKGFDFSVEVEAITNTQPPAFVWIVDNDRAIFSLSGGDATFLTNDKALISHLCQLTRCNDDI